VSGNPTSREESFLVRGGTRLSGEISVAGAKNSVLKLMAVALMAEGRTTLTNCPSISDVPAMADVLRHLGCTVEISGDTVVIDTPAEPGHIADDKAAQRLRASVCILGPLVGRHHRAVIAMPGGDAIGSRPLNWHQNGLNRLGARTRMDHGRLVAEATELRGASYELIRGVDELTPVSHRVIGDRIVAATWAMGAVMTRGDVTVTGIDPMFIHVVLENLRAVGADVETGPDHIRVRQEGRPRARDIRTLPFPGFPTDLQPMAIALASVSEGVSVVTENLFEARFRFVEEMVRMGVDAETDGHHAKIVGRERLDSATVWASDIRAGAGLVLAGMCADDVTEVCEVFHIDRGYSDFVGNVRSLGGDIERVPTHR